MFGGMNVFRILGDVSHTASKCILIWAIHSNKSSEGISLVTQILYAVVFCSRYMDLFWVNPAWSIWNFVLKIFYITSSIYIIVLMLKVYARTREREKSWRLGGYALGGSVIAAPIVCLIFRGIRSTNVWEILWTFSIILEAFCILPQLLLLRQTTVPTVIDSFYLVTLGVYRAFYIVNWVERGIEEHTADPIAIIFGVIQTAFYVDFAWVYWTRQRVKLRHGGIVDADDLRKSFIVNKIISAGRPSSDGDDEAVPDIEGNLDGESHVQPVKTSRWGVRGVSVSADDTLNEHDRKKSAKAGNAARDGSRTESQGMLEDDDGGLFSDGDDDAPELTGHEQSVMNSDQAWSGGK